MNRESTRMTAGKVLRSDDMIDDEKEVAVRYLRANPQFGYPHAVRCMWCGETRTLFRDENDAPFKIEGRGWMCEKCNTMATSQEIRF